MRAFPYSKGCPLSWFILQRPPNTPLQSAAIRAIIVAYAVRYRVPAHRG